MSNPTDRPQKPRECEHWRRGWCAIAIKAVYRPRRATPDFVHEYCYGICPDFTPKIKEKDDSRTSNTSNN